MNPIFLADISHDIDDLMAIEYLRGQGRLDGVVLDGKSRDVEREALIEKLGIPIFDEIPEGTEVVFCGGALTKVADYIRKGGPLKTLVMNGFYAGTNIVPPEHVLPKFRKRVTCRSYNPGLDPDSAEFVLRADLDILLVSKNVCHSENNVQGKWHEETYACPLEKRLHDVLMAKEGLNLLDGKEMLCEYSPVNVYQSGNQWGSVYNESSKTKISIFYKKDLPN